MAGPAPARSADTRPSSVCGTTARRDSSRRPRSHTKNLYTHPVFLALGRACWRRGGAWGGRGGAGGGGAAGAGVGTTSGGAAEKPNLAAEKITR